MKDQYAILKQIFAELNAKAEVRSSHRLLTKQFNKAKHLFWIIIRANQEYNTAETQLLYEKAQKVFHNIKILVEQKRKSEIFSFKATATAIIFTKRLKESAKMTTILEIIKTVPSLIPQYSGDGDKLNGVIAALKACKVLITNENKAVAIQVILSRFEGKARSAVGDNPQDVDEIIKSLTDKCTITVAPETIVAKLNSIKQNGEINKFTEQIEKLTLDLERAYISDKIPVETASKMAVKAGVKALASGLRSEETKLIIKAGQFSTLSSAIEKVTEHEPTTSKIFQVNANNSGNRYFNYRTGQTRGNGRGYQNYRGNNRGRGSSRGRHGPNQY